MASEQETLQRRLTKLREHDRTGFYSGNDSASGQDESGAVTVTVDPTDRVSLVEVSRDSETVRTPDGLARTVDEAFRAARLNRLSAQAPPRRTSGKIPVARGPVNPPLHPVENWMGTDWMGSGRRRAERDRGPRPHTADKDFGPTAGMSDNECVTVTLDIASSHGTVAADPGWLANAQPSLIGDAITQAFAAAYRKRDAS